MKTWRQDRKRALFCVVFCLCVLTLFDWHTTTDVYIRSGRNSTDNESTTLTFDVKDSHPKNLPNLKNKTRTVKFKCPPCPGEGSVKMVGQRSNSSLNLIKCSVNGVYTIDCRKDNDEVYMPVSFVEKYFEVGF
ncbi:D-glucuronyl C5-epimerase [Elysia marginata]|uniref:D-glucuronyl C5-epimerase n=1 Tax=Elysia marginata TaxID=1093978 RepID=A0AAV4JT31_9GAST|nr:D-glucuronyl C5-epimerase [Elysia marginata]